jgi:capsular exopolysaccharide synthesis family protein
MAQHADWADVEALDPMRAESSLDLFGIMWRRKWIVLCVIIISGALGYLYYLQATRIYRSTARILLIKKDANPVTPTDGRRESAYGGYEDTLSTHMLLICSPLIVNKAVERFHLDTLESLKNSPDAVSAIIQGLTATRAGDKNTPDPNVMDLYYEGVDAGDTAQILSGVVQSYQEHLRDTFQNFSEETLQLISQAKDELSKQLSEKESAHRQFLHESPLLWQGRESSNLHEVRMAEIEKARSLLLVANAQLKAEIEAIEAALKQGGNREALAMLASKAKANSDKGGRGPREAVEEKLFTAMLEQQDLLEDYGPDHPRVKAVEKKMRLLREQLGNMPLPEAADTADFLAVYLDSLKQEMRVSQQRLAEYDSLFERERSSAKDLAQFHLQDEMYRNDIARTKQMFDAVIKRLEEISLVKDADRGINMQLLFRPGHGELVQPQLLKVLGLVAVIGIVVGLGLAYLVDIADKSFRSPDEIRRTLGLPVLGHIPVIEQGRHAEEDEEHPGLARIVCTYHQPKGRSAEAYRAVRTGLYFSAHGEGHKVIQITSPNPGDGKTTLAANLAVSMADSDKRVLLVEADFRRPRVHKYFALDNEVGVSSVIAGDAEILDAIQQTPVKNLWAMPCGPRPHNPSDLLTSPRFKELIDLVRDQYDFIIIDTPPILAVTDSSVVAPRADAVLLVVRLTKHARDSALRTTEMLNGLGARILGVVVNGIGKTAGYGYGYQRYGSYRYGYGYQRYGGYQYSSRYSSGENGESGGYYGEDEERPAKRRAARAKTEAKPEEA